MKTLALFLVQPKRAASRIKLKPHWLVAFLTLSALAVLAEHFLQPFALHDLYHHLPQSVTPHDRIEIEQDFHESAFSRLLFCPIRLFVGWGLFALVLYTVCRAIVPRERFRLQHIFAIEIHAEAANILARFAALVVLVIARGSTGGNLLVPLGAEQLFRPSDLFTASILNSMNGFSLLYVVLLSASLEVIGGIGRLRAFFIVFVVWSISVLVNIGILALLRDEFHFSL